ncbi:MAG: filamentous hemagglutinin N-terminal domain-containing protein [Cyanobacteriota bacterium]|nr:filamentous hemagglutinin N-terminal domain-containing protein [Cyanobacteriota bacterium]
MKRDRLACLVSLGFILWGNSVPAQLLPDATLGTENSLVTPEVQRLLVEGGATRGTNLFHSFLEFNVGENQRVDFANPATIQNILTRVTGTNVSNILGTLGVDGGANLFLLNPNGIIFGPNAQLDIRGSFVATTANSILFDNAIEYSATNPQAPPLLTVSVPLGLQYGSNNAGIIRNEGILSVGGNLTLGGGNLDLQGQVWANGDVTLQAMDRLRIRDSETQPFIAASGGKLVVQGNESVDIFALNHIDSGFYSGGDMVLRSRNGVGGDAHYWSGGNFRIEKLDGSLGDLYSPYDPIIRSLGDVLLNNYEGTSLHILAGGSINIDNIKITDRDLTGNAINPIANPGLANVTLSDGTSLTIDGTARPTLDIRAGMDAAAIGLPIGLSGNNFSNINGFLFPNVINSDINIGDIEIEEADGVVLITNNDHSNGLTGNIIINGLIDTSSFIGDAGDVYIDSRGDLTFTGMGAIDTSPNSPFEGGDIRLIARETISLVTENNYVESWTLGTGRSGDIYVDTGSLILTGGAQLRTPTYGSGRAGNITVIASDTIEISGYLPNPSNDPNPLFNNSAFNTRTIFGSGDAGNIRIEAQKLILRDGGNLYTKTFGVGRSGDITIIAGDSVEVVGAPVRDEESSIFTGNNGDGNAGDIWIETGRLLIQEGGQIAAESKIGTIGAPGDIRIMADESVEVIGVPLYPGGKPTGIFTFTQNFQLGGEIRIDTKRFIVQDGASISTGTDAAGDGGDLIVNASQYVQVIGASAFDPNRVSRIRAITSNSGDGGNLIINTGQLLVQHGGLVSADSFGSGNSGSLIVNALNSVQVTGVSPNGQNQSRLFFDSSGSGNAGELRITTGRLIVRDGGRVSAATSGSGQAGLLEVNALDSVQVIGTSNNGQYRSQLFFDSSGTGDAGTLKIDTARLMVEDGGLVSAATSSTGQAGLLEVNASDLLAIVGTSADGQYQSQLFFDSTGAGNAGQLKIDTGRLLVSNGGSVSAATSSAGQAGLLEVNASDSVDVIGTSNNGQHRSQLFFDSTGSGNAGRLQIDTARLSVQDGGLVSAATSNTGQGGILNVNAIDSVQVIGNNSSLLFDSSGTGDAGELRINTGNLLIQDGGRVSAGTSGSGRGGLLEVNATESVRVDGTGSRLFFDSSGTGDARGIRVATGDLRVGNGGEITVSGTGTGLAGDLEIAADSIFLNQQGNLLARTLSGEGGNIRLNVADNVLLRFNSNILTEALGTGNGGDITIDTGGFVLAVLPENSDVAATAIQGRGGNIFVTATGVFGFSLPEQLVRTPESDISAASELGIDGTTEVVVRDFQPVVQLPQVGTPALGGGCLSRYLGTGAHFARGEFFVTGRGGLPPSPTDPLSGNRPVPVPWLTLESQGAASDERVEAKGVVETVDGRVFLTAREVSSCSFLSEEKE